jgi:IS30 family transposase
MARAKRWPRSRGTDRRGEIADLLSIHVRPPQINERQFPGHWEGDLIKGAANLSAVGTLVERSSRLLMLVKLPHPQPATAAHVLQAFSDKLLSIAQPMRQSLTYDRGKEMACHRQLSERTGIAVYFCDPHSPWQRGTNENTNGLVRQYLPKGTVVVSYRFHIIEARLPCPYGARSIAGNPGPAIRTLGSRRSPSPKHGGAPGRPGNRCGCAR